MEAMYVRGRLSVDAYLKQCAVVNPHLQLHYRVTTLKDLAAAASADAAAAAAAAAAADDAAAGTSGPAEGPAPDAGWTTFARVSRVLPEAPREIKPHPHGVELGMLMQMLKDTSARTLRAALAQDFSRVSSAAALRICEAAALSPKARPSRIAHKESEALYRAVKAAKLMRPPTDCLSPIGEEHILEGLKKEIAADFYTAVTRPPAVYRGNPFQIEVGLAYARAGMNEDLGAEDAVRVLRFANRVPLLYMSGACACTRAVGGVNWKSYGLSQPKGSLPLGPMVVMIHMASVWVPFTSESKEAIAHYPEILREMTFAVQESGRRLAVFLRKRHRQAEAERKRQYMAMYIPHLALGLRQVLDLPEKQQQAIAEKLAGMLERTHLET
jgi:DNA topoisomerase-6 subunit B